MDLSVLFFSALIFALIGSAIGNAKGRAGAGFALGLLLGPIGWLLVAVGPNYKEEAKRKEERARHSQSDNLDALSKLAELKEKGVLTEDEFLAKKKELLK